MDQNPDRLTEWRAFMRLRGSTLVDGNAFRKIEGIVEGDRGSRVHACKWSITIKSTVREGFSNVEWLDTRRQGAHPPWTCKRRMDLSLFSLHRQWASRAAFV